jgi:hypothetical protein
LGNWEIGKLGYRYIGEGRIGGTGGLDDLSSGRMRARLRVGAGS